MSTSSSTSNFQAIALYDNFAESPDELAFAKGDTLEVIERNLPRLDGWWLCQFKGKTGIAPANRLQPITNRILSRQISNSSTNKLYTQSKTENSSITGKAGNDSKYPTQCRGHQPLTSFKQQSHSENDYDYVPDSYGTHLDDSARNDNIDEEKNVNIDLPDYDVPVCGLRTYYYESSKTGSSEITNNICNQSRHFADYDEIEERGDYDIVGPVNQSDYDVPIASEHREEGKLIEMEEQPSYDIPVSYTKDILTESDQCRNIGNSKFCKLECDQLSKDRISHASIASLGSEQHQTSNIVITNESLDQPDYDIPESLHQPDYDIPEPLDQPDYDIPEPLDQPDYDIPESLDQPDYDIPESQESALHDKSKSSDREGTRVVLASNYKNYDISNVNSSKQSSQLLKKDNRIDQSNSSSSSVVAGSPSKFSDQSQKEVVVDPTIIFGAENYKYSAIYAQSDDFSSKISKWKQRSNSIKGIDLKLLIGLTYIDHLQREILKCSKNLIGHKKLGWHTVSSLESSIKNIRIYLKQLNAHTIEFADVGKRCLVNCYYSDEENKEVIREIKEELQQLIDIRNTITESYKELDDINWKIEFISAQYSGTLDRVMLVTSQLPKICHSFFLVVLKNSDTIFSNNVNINSKNSVTIEDRKISFDTATMLTTAISDINKEENDVIQEGTDLGKRNSDVEQNILRTSVNNNPEQLYTEKLSVDQDTENSLECRDSNVREPSSDDVTDNSDLIRTIFDERAPEFQQKFQSLGEEFKILVKCIRDQEGVNVMLEKGKKIIIGAHSIIFVADFCNDRLPDCDVKQELQNRVTKLVDAITAFAAATKKVSASYPSRDSLQRMVRASKDLSTISKELVVYAASLKTK